jgi:2-dehydropantoate 2-reductase
VKPHWHVLGAGAMGCLFAAQLQRGGCKCTLLLKNSGSRLNNADQSVGITITEQDQESAIDLPLSVCADSAYISHLLITTKAYDAPGAIAAISHRLDKESHILILVNGMGLREQLESLYPRLCFYSGTTTEAAYRSGDHSVVHAGSGTTKIGGRAGSTPPDWFASWSELEIQCLWERDIEGALWQKMAINCAINPLTALYCCNNGELLTTDGLADQLRGLCEEIARVSSLAGQADSAVGFYQQVCRVIEGTAANRSSMLQDVLANRPTEVDSILGFLVDTAKNLGTATPISDKLLSEIKQLEGRQVPN